MPWESIEKGSTSSQWFIFKEQIRTIANQKNVGAVSRAKLGKLLRWVDYMNDWSLIFNAWSTVNHDGRVRVKHNQPNCKSDSLFILHITWCWTKTWKKICWMNQESRNRWGWSDIPAGDKACKNILWPAVGFTTKALNNGSSGFSLWLPWYHSELNGTELYTTLPTHCYCVFCLFVFCCHGISTHKWVSHTGLQLLASSQGFTPSPPTLNLMSKGEELSSSVLSDNLNQSQNPMQCLHYLATAYGGYHKYTFTLYSASYSNSTWS